jgi:hypothetical protein
MHSFSTYYLPGGCLHVQVAQPLLSTWYLCWQRLEHCLTGHGGGAEKNLLWITYFDIFLK